MPESTIYSYKELVVWQKSVELVVTVYKLTESFPKSELYGLVSQMRRAAVSIPSNIAKGTQTWYKKRLSSFSFACVWIRRRTRDTN